MAKNKKSELGKAPPTLQNKKARHNFNILDEYEAGIVLSGPEVKSIRAGKGNLTESYVRVIAEELWLMGLHINPYENAGYANTEAARPRKLLLHRREIDRIAGRIREKGETAVALRLFWTPKGKIKVQIALATGKNVHDKRDTLRKKTLDREASRAIRNVR